MSAAQVLARIEALGARADVKGGRLRVVAPRGALCEGDRAELSLRKVEILELVRSRLFDGFLADCSIPFAVFHSHALERDFVLARDASALEALGEPERRLPVLTFADCEKLAGLGATDLALVLNVREAFGPAAELHAVRPRLG